MADEYNRKILQGVIGNVCDVIGWQAVQPSALETLADVLQRYLEKMGHLCKGYSEVSE